MAKSCEINEIIHPIPFSVKIKTGNFHLKTENYLPNKCSWCNIQYI